MKKILIPCFALLLGTGAIAQTQQDVLNQMTAVANQHNQSLDAVYNSLSANAGRLNTDAPNQDKIDILIGIESPTFPTPPLPTGAVLKSGSIQSVNNAVLQSLSKDNTRSLSDVIMSNTKLSADETVYYNRLTDIINRDYNNSAAMEKEIASFNSSVFQQFGVNSNSTYILIAASSVAKASVNYWNANSVKWAALNPAAGSGKLQQSCCGGIATSDAAGAASGAVGGAIAGAAVGGVGALPGAAAGAVAGGLSASAGAAVTSLIHWLWP